MDDQVYALVEKMEKALAGKKEFLVGDHYTLADVVGTCFCARVHLIRRTDAFGPNVKNYWAKVQGRPSYKDANVIANIEGSKLYEHIVEYKSRA